MTSKRLLERRRKLAGGLPPIEDVLRGSVVRRILRCGKPGCHCADGDGHPATYLCVTLKGGRTEQISLPEQLVEQAERQVTNYHAWWDAIEQISALNRDLLREARATARSKRRKPARQ